MHSSARRRNRGRTAASPAAHHGNITVNLFRYLQRIPSLSQQIFVTFANVAFIIFVGGLKFKSNKGPKFPFWKLWPFSAMPYRAVNSSDNSRFFLKL
jgi:hypothetical protein